MELIDGNAIAAAIITEGSKSASAKRALLHAAGAAIDAVHEQMGHWLRPGRTEREVGADIAGEGYRLRPAAPGPPVCSCSLAFLPV